MNLDQLRAISTALTDLAEGLQALLEDAELKALEETASDSDSEVEP